MTLPEAAYRLRILAAGYQPYLTEDGKRVTPPEMETYVVSGADMEALTFAAGFLSVFVEALEESL